MKKTIVAGLVAGIAMVGIASPALANPVHPRSAGICRVYAPPMAEYTVKAGDTLWSIAVKYYGDGSLYYRIQRANGLPSTTIYPGQVLRVPL